MTQSNIQELIKQPLTMEVTEFMVINATVLDENNIQYQFVDEDDPGVGDEFHTAPIEIKYDDIDHVEDYSFDIGGMSRYFLHQFSVVSTEK